MTNPLSTLLAWLPAQDFGVMDHHFAKHGRDYVLLVETCLGSSPGQHEVVFTHCVRLDYETRVSDDVWPKSWTDEFIAHKQWAGAEEPGYAWGTNWSLAYPGLRANPDSALASEWTRRLGKEMFEATLETDRFFLRLIFHSLCSRKLNENCGTVSQVLHRL